LFVYKYTNKVNGKIYIGITKRDIDTRHKEHIRNINDGYIFHNALKKYGIDNFHLELIDIAKDYAELKEKEKLYIKQFNSYVRFPKSNGYNNTLGGEGTIGFKFSEVQKRRISVQKKEFYSKNPHPAKGRIVTEIQKRRQQKAMKGKYDGINNPFYGKKHDKEKCKQLSISAKNRIKRDGHHMKGKKHSDETKKKIGLKSKERNASKNLMFSKEQGIEQRTRHSEYMSGSNNPNAVKIICLTTNEVFDYGMSASKKYNIDRSNLTKCLKGKLKYAGLHPETGERLLWIYYSDHIGK
jgi:group I intron endonuclease